MPVSPGRPRAEDDHERESSVPAGSAGRLIPLKLLEQPAGLSLSVGWFFETFAWRNYRIKSSQDLSTHDRSLLRGAALTQPSGSKTSSSEIARKEQI